MENHPKKELKNERRKRKKSVIKTIIDDMKEDYNAQKAIDKENFAKVQEDSKRRHQELTKPNEDFVEFKETKGIINKIKVIGSQARRNSKKII